MLAANFVASGGAFGGPECFETSGLIAKHGWITFVLQLFQYVSMRYLVQQCNGATACSCLATQFLLPWLPHT